MRDNRLYEVIELKNKMSVLLVSDPKAVKSLASLALPVGSLQDPPNQQGLAHYTEHMVLMGSKTYPMPADFSLFLSRHSGRYNASTAAYRTAFYFEVENRSLESALDRLASAIAEPNFDPKFSDKERNAVNAELTMARSNDGFRIRQVDAETINQNHPASQFSGGNLETLSDKLGNDKNSRLHQALIDFHQDYYSANIMVGVIYGVQSVSELTAMAEKTFGKIANRNVVVPKIKVDALTNDTLGKQIRMVPAQSKKVLYLQFAIENNITAFAEKSDQYLAYLISNRSRNTLFDQLQKKGLIENIQANPDPMRYGNSGVFSIIVSLTDAGMAQKEHVIASIFSYLDLIKNKGIKADYYQELKQILALDFEYQSIERDMSYVEWLSDQMLHYPPQNILNADYIATYFNQQAIVDRLNTLTPNNVRIWTISPTEQTNKLAYFVDAPYAIDVITTKQKQRWQTLAKQFHFELPELNPYIANDFSIIKPEAKPDRPAVFRSTGNHLHFPSRFFSKEPKAAMVISLRNNESMSDVKSQVEFQLLDYIVNRALAQLKFQASVAGISISTSSDNGVMMISSGFSQHLAKMAMSIFDHYQNVDITEDNLQLAKSWYLQELNAADNQNSYKLAMQPLQALNAVPYYDRGLKRQVLPQITVTDIRQYREKLLSNAVPYMLSLGNISNTESLHFYRELQAKLKRDAKSVPAQFIPPDTITINSMQSALITKDAASSDHALLMSYVPEGYDEIQSSVLAYALYKIINPWFYDQLRSHEQLGYAVFTLPAYLGKSVGIGFLIQSNQYSPEFLLTRYQAFYPTILEKLAQLSEHDIEQYKQAIIDELRLPPQTLDMEFERYLPEYRDSHFSFDTITKKIAQTNDINKQDLIDFFTKAVIKHKGVVLASQVIGAASDDNVEIKQIKASKKLESYTPFETIYQLQQILLKQTKNKATDKK